MCFRPHGRSPAAAESPAAAAARRLLLLLQEPSWPASARAQEFEFEHQLRLEQLQRLQATDVDVPGIPIRQRIAQPKHGVIQVGRNA